MKSLVTPSPNLLAYLTVALKMVEEYCSPLLADAATLIPPIYKLRSNDINSFFEKNRKLKIPNRQVLVALRCAENFFKEFLVEPLWNFVWHFTEEFIVLF
jgi:hypothetical protein